MKKGKVTLIGAGPGDPGLLTCRAREILERADAVVFDRLVGDGILALIPRNAESINVGKEGGNHPVPQNEIEKILVKKALEGKNTVRLKGGDPFVFGRGGEEIETLLRHNIPFEVIPGVTSCIAAPAQAGIPVTHRGVANSFHVITAHTKDGTPAPQDYDAIARLKGTLIFLMGVSAIPAIRDGLISRGYDPETPVAAVERGTTAHQRTITGVLKDFPETAAREHLTPPAALIVGEVTRFAGTFARHGDFPLAGKKIAVTRPSQRIGTLARTLRDMGAEVIELPCIETETINTDLPDLSGYGVIGFTSITGVESFFELLAAGGKDIRSIGNAKIAAIGPGTARALARHGLTVDCMPDVYDGVHMASLLAAEYKKSRVLMLRARDGSPGLTQALENSGINFTEIPLYTTRTIPAPFTPRDIDAVLFTSASTVRGWHASCPDTQVKTVCCIGVQTAAQAEALGMHNIRIARKATIPDLIATLTEGD